MCTPLFNLQKRPLHFVVLTTAGLGIYSAESTGQTDFSQAVINYADTMVEYGRDRYGRQHSDMFVTMLTRSGTPGWISEGSIGNVNGRSVPGWETRYYDRAWGGGNWSDHVQLHELFDQLSDTTGNNNYRNLSNSATAFTFKQTQDPDTKFLVWGEHLSWNIQTETYYTGQNTQGLPHSDTHEVKDRISHRMWERIYEVAPDEAFAFAEGLWDHQIYNQNTGQFSRHAKYTTHGPSSQAASFPRVGGWMTLAWSEAYSRSDDPAYRAKMLNAIDTITALYENNIGAPTGAIAAGLETVPKGSVNYRTNTDWTGSYWLNNNLYLAVELELAKVNLPQDIADRLTALQERIDTTATTKLEHNLDGHLTNHRRGFMWRGRPDLPLDSNGNLQRGDLAGGLQPDDEIVYTTTWDYGYGSPLTSTVGRQMSERYRATGDERFVPLITQAASIYIDREIPSENVSGMALAEAIHLLLDANEFSGDIIYFDRAYEMGVWSLDHMLDGSALPRATSSHNFYEALLGGDDLILALNRLDNFTPVPEPGMLGVLGALSICMFGRRRRAM